MRRIMTPIVVGLAFAASLSGSGVLAGEWPLAADAGDAAAPQAAQACLEAEVNPVTGHALCQPARGPSRGAARVGGAALPAAAARGRTIYVRAEVQILGAKPKGAGRFTPLAPLNAKPPVKKPAGKVITA